MMRKFWILWVIALGAFACTNSTDTPLPSAQQTAQILSTGAWKVSYFYDKTKDETSRFSGYRFTFEANGGFTASTGAATYSGTWRRFRDDGLERLELLITGTDALDEMSDDWVLEKMEERRIELRDDNKQDLEELHLVRE